MGLAGDHHFNLDDVELLEVYQSPAEIPGRFTGSEAQCGVVAIWTRRW